MSIQGRSLIQQQYEAILERTNPQKLRLIRANPFNCTGGLCFQNGRQSLNNNCPVCFGTGYLGLTQDADGNLFVTATGAPYSDQAPPASQFYFITADLQTGHGLYGAGGDYLKLMIDLGRERVGDATLFTKYYDHDRQTGKRVYPLVDPTLTRPDRIISKSGAIYNVVQQQLIELGSETVARVFTLEQGIFTAVRGTAAASR